MKSVDRAPAVERRPSGATPGSGSGSGSSRCARRWSLKAASFRTWPGSRADVARDPGHQRRPRRAGPAGHLPRAGIRPRWSGLRVQGTA